MLAAAWAVRPDTAPERSLPRTALFGSLARGDVYDRRGSRVPASRRGGRSARTVRPRSPAGALPPDLREATHDDDALGRPRYVTYSPPSIPLS